MHSGSQHFHIFLSPKKLMKRYSTLKHCTTHRGFGQVWFDIIRGRYILCVFSVRIWVRYSIGGTSFGVMTLAITVNDVLDCRRYAELRFATRCHFTCALPLLLMTIIGLESQNFFLPLNIVSKYLIRVSLYLQMKLS